MNDLFEKIADWPVSKRVIALFGILLLVVGGYYYFLYGGLSERIAKVDKEVNGKDGLKIKISEREALARNIDKYRVEVAKLDKELNTAISELPDKKQIAALLSRISDKARDAGLDIKSFKPAGTKKKDFYAEVPVNISVTGTFHEVATFFDEVGRLDRIVNIGAYNISEPEVSDEKVQLSASVTATAFRFLDEAERAQEANKGKGKKKRRGKKKRK